MFYSLIVVLGVLIFPVLMFPISLISLCRSRKNWRVHIFAVSMFFAWMAYCYQPLGTPDLVRYFQYVESLADYSFIEAVTHIYEGQSNLYVFNLMGWLAMQFQDKHLLPAVSTFVVYYIGLYITCSVGESENIDLKYIRRYIVFILCIVDWYAVANNVRNILAFCVVSLAVFRDIYQKKRDIITILCYILPVFLHPTAIIIVFVRFILTVTVKWKIFLSISVILVCPIIEFIYEKILPYINSSFINQLIVKMYGYFFNKHSSWGIEVSHSKFYKVNKIVYLSVVIAFCVMAVIYYYRECRREKIDYKGASGLVKYQQFVFIIGSMAIACAWMLTPEYWRFATPLIICGSILFLPCTQKRIKVFPMKLCLNYLIFLAPVWLMMWFYRRMQELDALDLLISVLLKNPITAILKDFIYISRN